MILYENFEKILHEEDITDIDSFDRQDLASSLGLKTKLVPEDLLRAKIVADKDSQSKNNKIVRPQGIIFQDTFNNFIFPIQPNPRIDTARFDTAEVFKRFRELYLNFPSMFLPWHFVIEMIGNRYYIFQTRPIDTKFPLSNQEVLDAKHDFKDDIITKFFENKTYQIENMIHVCLVGDSDLDVYPDKLYRLIGRTCVAPLFRDMRITGSVESRTFGFNLGKKFKLNNIIKFARK
jgi:hypothetical protein